jgi:hypothetical protein
MTEPIGRDPLEAPDLLDPSDAGLPAPDRSGHGKRPELDGDQLALIAQRELTRAGSEGARRLHAWSGHASGPGSPLVQRNSGSMSSGRRA